MQVFIIGTPLETAMALDKRRLNKQILECQQILNAIWGKSKAWKNHPCTLQYSDPKNLCCWLLSYRDCLISYQNGFMKRAEYYSNLAKEYKPVFHILFYLFYFSYTSPCFVFINFLSEAIFLIPYSGIL